MSADGSDLLDQELDDLVSQGLEQAEAHAGLAPDPVEETEPESVHAVTVEPDPEPEPEPAGETEEPEAPAAVTREDGAQWNATAQRWQKDGKFVEGGPPEGVAQAEPQPSAQPEAPQWAPFSVTVDRATVPIPEAVIAKANGHTLLAIPDDKLPDFQRRVVRGVAAERMWRQLDQGVRQLEEERKALASRPAVRSDAEVEADVLMEVLKPHLAELFDEQSLENLQLKVKLAQREERDKLQTYETERRTKATQAETQSRTQAEGIAQAVVDLVEDPRYATEFQTMTDDDLRAVVQDLMKVARAVYWQEGDQWFRNTELVYDRLRQYAARPAATSTSQQPTTPTPAGAPPAGTTARAPERFNKGQQTAATPPSTSVKAARPAARPAPATHHRAPTPSQSTPMAAQTAEDAFRTTKRRFLSSPGLDFPDDDE